MIFKIVYVMPNGNWFFFSDLAYSTIEAAVAEKCRYDFGNELRIATPNAIGGWTLL